MKRLAWALSVAGVFALGASTGCGGAQGGSGFGKDAGGGGNKDATLDVSQQSDNYVPILKYDSGGEGSGCDTHCSADLHDVLDCNNMLLKTCPASEGCGPGGACVPACQSAAANQSTVGCDYYSVVPAGGPDLADGSCFAAYIANTWNGPVTLTVDYLGAPLSLASMAVIPTGTGKAITYTPLVGGVLPEGQLAILFLTQAPDVEITCPTPTGVPMDTQIDTSGIVNGFHITSSAPVVAYDIYPYGGASADLSSATLLIPTTAWGTNYLAVDAFSAPMLEFTGLYPFIQIVAAEDGTEVTVSPTVAIVGGTGVAPAAMGVPTTYTINAGQVLQFLQEDELNGTPIKSTKPIGVWGGANCMNIDPMDEACDSGHQQLFPISALGNEYVAVRYRPRDPAQPDEAPPWRIMAAVDGTILTYDPATPPAGAPTTLNSGELAMFYSAGPFTVTSQDNKHPFYISAHMGGENFMGGNYTSGDPEYVNVTPPLEYLSSYIFMTDPTFGNTNLVLVRPKTTSGTFNDVTLDCQGTPVVGWTPVGTSGNYEYAWVDLLIGDVPQGACNNGYHTIKSDGPFGLTVWGWDSYDSYAFAAGASVQPINSVVVLPTPK
jgi:IgGFc binding protein